MDGSVSNKRGINNKIDFLDYVFLCRKRTKFFCLYRTGYSSKTSILPDFIIAAYNFQWLITIARFHIQRGLSAPFMSL